MISPVDFLKNIHPNPEEFICISLIFPKDRREKIPVEKQKSMFLPVDIDDNRKFIFRCHALFIPINLWIKRKDFKKKIPLLHALNKRGWGIYYSVAGFGEKKNKYGRPSRDRENVRRVQILFADFDFPTDASRAFEAGQGFDLLPPPNYIVRTSENKLQTIWLAECPISFETAEAALLYISIKTGSDPAVKDLSRVLRLPGFKNTKLKSDNFQVSVEKLHDKKLDNDIIEKIAAEAEKITPVPVPVPCPSVFSPGGEGASSCAFNPASAAFKI